MHGSDLVVFQFLGAQLCFVLFFQFFFFVFQFLVRELSKRNTNGFEGHFRL